MLAEVDYRPPRILTERLALRGFEPGDAAAVLRYASDPETTQFMFWERCRGLADAECFLNEVVAAEHRNQGLIHAITLKCDESEVVGAVSLVWRERGQQVMELGYILCKELWGRGLIIEAGRALMAHAFATTEVEHIFAPIFAPNAKSRRAAEKMGMQLDGVLRSYRNMHGRRWDLAIYSLLRGELG